MLLFAAHFQRLIWLDAFKSAGKSSNNLLKLLTNATVFLKERVYRATGSKEKAGLGEWYLTPLKHIAVEKTVCLPSPRDLQVFL